MKPRISIITPAYNSGFFIEETYKSILAQTYTNWEWIVLDDGSTDNTSEIVKNIAEKEARVSYYFQENGRQGKARNHAIGKAKGEFLAFLDADDLWVANKLEKQLETFQVENCDLVYTSGSIFKNTISEIQKEVEIEVGLQNNNELIIKQLFGYSLPILSVLVKTEWVKKVGGFDENLQVQNAEDYQLWLKLNDAGVKMFGLNEKLFYYRQHPNQATASDSLALPQSIVAISRAEISSVSNTVKMAIINKRVNRYLIHNYYNLSTQMKTKVIELYNNPMKKFGKYLLVKLLNFISPKLLLKFGYKFWDLTESIN